MYIHIQYTYMTTLEPIQTISKTLLESFSTSSKFASTTINTSNTKTYRDESFLVGSTSDGQKP